MLANLVPIGVRIRPIRLPVLADTARSALAGLVESGEAEICYVENGHLPDEVARWETMLGHVGSAPLASGTSREGGIGG
jgi:hypothetical protein